MNLPEIVLTIIAIVHYTTLCINSYLDDKTDNHHKLPLVSTKIIYLSIQPAIALYRSLCWSQSQNKFSFTENNVNSVKT